MDDIKQLRYIARQFAKPKNWKLWLIALAFLLLTVVPALLWEPDLETLKTLGYIGFFIANYFGWGLYVLPFLVTHLNPFFLVILGAFGSTIDEFVTWNLGRIAKSMEEENQFHFRFEKLIEKYGVWVIFILGILPTPGIVVNLSAMLCGHFGIPFPKYFAAGVAGRLISRTIWTYGFLLLIKRYGLPDIIQNLR